MEMHFLEEFWELHFKKVLMEGNLMMTAFALNLERIWTLGLY